MDYKKNRKQWAHSIGPVIGALLLVVASVGYILLRVMSDRAYNEKWKDYRDCGI